MLHKSTNSVQEFNLTSDEEWNLLHNSDDDDMFTGNENRNEIKKNLIINSVIGRFVRLMPVTWYGRISLRWELHGCGNHTLAIYPSC